MITKCLGLVIPVCVKETFLMEMLSTVNLISLLHHNCMMYFIKFNLRSANSDL